MENPIKMDDLGVPLFLETPIWQFLEFRTDPRIFFKKTYVHTQLNTPGSFNGTHFGGNQRMQKDGIII